MSLIRSDLVYKIWPEPYSPPCMDYFDNLPDPLILVIFNKVGNVKALGRCCVVSRRFRSLVPQVENVVVRVDCVISDDDDDDDVDDGTNSGSGYVDKSRGGFSNLVRLVFGGIVKPLHALGQLLGSKRSSTGSSSALAVGGNVDERGMTKHHSPMQVLRNFSEIRSLRIELPCGELGTDDGVLLKWKADFGSTLDKCVILGASSVVYPKKFGYEIGAEGLMNVVEDNGIIPESFYTNGGLKLRVVWTISSLIAASARHYLLQPIITEHKTLNSLVLTDVDKQGVLHMNRDQLEELRMKPLSASSASKRTLVPALNIRLWYAPELELPNGAVLKGATLVAVRPSDQVGSKKEMADVSWVANAFEEPFGSAARILVKRRTYCLEMNSF